MTARATVGPTDKADAPASSRWALLREMLRAQRRNLIIGTVIGLVWMVGKISVPILVRFGIDRGIDEGELLWLWASLIALATMGGRAAASRPT